MKYSVALADAAATEQAGRDLAKRLRPGHIVKITGPLGAGKTTFVRGIAAELGVVGAAVHSPTFSLVHDYDGTKYLIKHCDFYRLPENSALDEFGGLEFFDSDSIFLVEWPEQIRLWEYINPNRLIEADLQFDASGRMLRVSDGENIVD